MQWSRIKTIILILLALVNGFLLVLVVGREGTADGSRVKPSPPPSTCWSAAASMWKRTSSRGKWSSHPAPLPAAGTPSGRWQRRFWVRWRRRAWAATCSVM